MASGYHIAEPSQTAAKSPKPKAILKFQLPLYVYYLTYIYIFFLANFGYW